MILFLLTGVVLSLLILVQRGRGGGLAGAFGGPGGHSAFGTKTADVFVKATAVLGGLFFLLAIVTAIAMRPEHPTMAMPLINKSAPAAPAETPGEKPAATPAEAPPAAPAPATPAPVAPAAPADTKPVN